jgi:protein-tyrosine kinase
MDTSVLLVDGDVVQPELMRRLGLRAERGLLDLLDQPHLGLADLTLSTNVPKLQLLPAGTPSPYANELLASAAMERLLDAMTLLQPGRIVVFDAPPLLPTAEAEVLASRVGQVVLVVEASRTPRSAVIEALDKLDDCPIVLPLLNKASDAALQRTYGGLGAYGAASPSDGRALAHSHGAAELRTTDHRT